MTTGRAQGIDGSTQSPPRHLMDQLRTSLAHAISDFKAYDVPGVCRRIGLADGMEDEAYSSKNKYASKRLAGLPWNEVLGAARKLLSSIDDFYLSEAVAKVEEINIDTITEITRRRIVSLFDKRHICTEIEEIEFLSRLWPIGKTASVYGNSTLTFEDDIRQHTIANHDWENKELLEFAGSLSCSQTQFFKFLALVTDPLVQTAENQAELVEKINGYLFHDGYKLAQVRVRSGCPYFEVRPLPKGAPGDANTSKVLATFDSDEIQKRWHDIMTSRESDPGRTLTLARTLLEDVCKWIIVEAGETYQESADLPVLYRQLAKLMKLARDDHTEDIFKQILGGCQSVVQGLGSLRNKLGDAHSLGPVRARPSPRHAELAANLSGAMATFLVSTWAARKKESSPA
jgi:hypothetical protein